MKSNKTKGILLWTLAGVLALALVFFVVSSAFSLAWWKPFKTNFGEDKITFKTQMRTNYFESGSGTAEDPYIIHTDVQFYNFAWLQYLGLFNDADAPYYFELCDGSRNADGGIEGKNLDMSAYTLPPIGTSSYPFIGHFDGKGVTVSNLKISTVSTELTEFPVNEYTQAGGVQKIWDPNNDSKYAGVFGVLGPLTGTAGANNLVQNLYINQAHITASTTTSTMGVAAGYVNATLSNVGVIDSRITSNTATAADSGKTTNISDYTLVGYCTETYRETNNVVDNKLSKPELTVLKTDTLGGRGWGNSINMVTLYNRARAMQTVGDTNYTAYTYPTAETIYYHADGTRTREVTAWANIAEETLQSSTIYTNNDSGGSVRFTSTLGALTENYAYIDGIRSDLTKQVTRINLNSELNANAYYVVANNFLAVGDRDESTDAAIAAVTQPANKVVDQTKETAEFSGTRWVIDGNDNNYMYTYQNGIKYFLNLEGIKGAKSSSTEAVNNPGTYPTQWRYEGQKLIGRYNNHDYYVIYENGTWRIIPEATYFYIKDSSRYMNASTTSFSSTINAAQTQWFMDASGHVYHWDQSTNTFYYLNHNNTALRLQTTATDTWTQDATGLYQTIQDVKFYVVYDGNWRLVSDEYVTIYSNGYYMTLDSSGNYGTTTSEASATKFLYLTKSDGITLYSPETGYYIGALDAGGALTAVTTTDVTFGRYTARAWTQNIVGGQAIGYYYTYFGTDYYLVYEDSQWKSAKPGVYAFYIQDTNTGTYLKRASNDTLTGTKDVHDATRWMFENDSGTDVGYIYDVSTSATTKKYLFENDSGTVLISTASSAWRKPYDTTLNVIFKKDGFMNLNYHRGWLVYKNSTWTTVKTEGAITSIPSDVSPYPLTLTKVPLSQLKVTVHKIENVNAAKKANEAPTNQQINQSPYPLHMQIVYDPVTKKTGYGSYFPLKCSWNGSASASASEIDKTKLKAASDNTGYVVSSGFDSTTLSGGRGDIRISRYNENVADMATYDTQNKWYTNVLTVKETQSGTFISEEIDPETQEYLRFDDAGQKLYASMAGHDNYYGLHFMTSTLSTDNIVTADYASIGNVMYEDYELPAPSIDFNVEHRGFISFFAGTYYTGNNSFFALYQIGRNQYKEISSIREISTIYVNEDDLNAGYIYQYTDSSSYFDTNGNVVSLPSGYTKRFDRRMIGKQSNLYNRRLYFFEIPVNAGEYAIGSATDSNSTGAYLLYLDLCADAGVIKGQKLTTINSSSVTQVEFPKGVYLTDDNKVLDEDKSAVLALSGKGSVNLKLSGTTVTATTSGSVGTSKYIGSKVTMQNGSGTPISITSTNSKYTVEKNVRFYVFDSGTGTVSLKAHNLTRILTVNGATTRTFTKVVAHNGLYIDGADDNKAFGIGSGTGELPLALEYRYKQQLLPTEITVSDSFTIKDLETILATITEYPVMGVNQDQTDVIYKPNQVFYQLSVRPNTGSVVVAVDYLNGSLATLNGTSITQGQKYTVTP